MTHEWSIEYKLHRRGRVNKCNFVNNEVKILKMCIFPRYLYTQPLDKANRAQHGPCFITNTLDLKHLVQEIKDLSQSAKAKVGAGLK